MNNKNWIKKIFQILFAAFVIVSVMGCSGNNGGENPDNPVTPADDPTESFTLLGHTAHPKIKNGVVTIYNDNGVKVGTARTDSNGCYSLTVAKEDLGTQYTLKVSGGYSDDKTFSGTLEAKYALTHPENKANITPITSLVAKVSGAEGSLDSAVDKLASMGMIDKGNWYDDSQAKVDEWSLDVMGAHIDNIETWVNEVAEDVKDNDLNAQYMDVFPEAHGGVLSLSVPEVESGKLYFFKGYGSDTQMTAHTVHDEVNVSWELVNPPAGVTIDSTTGKLHIEDIYDGGRTVLTAKAVGGETAGIVSSISSLIH